MMFLKKRDVFYNLITAYYKLEKNAL